MTAEEVEALCQWRPILQEHPPFRRFATVFLTRPFVGESGRQLLTEQVVYRVFGCPTRYRSGNIPAVEAFLRLYRLQVDRLLRWTDYHGGAGYVREVKADGIPESIRILHRERIAENQDRQFALTGNKLTLTASCKLREKQRNAISLCAPYQTPPVVSERWICYLNARDARTFDLLRSNLDEAFGVVERLPSVQARIQTKAALNVLRVQPMPIYRPSVRSPRIVAPRSLHSIQSDVRRVLYPDNRWIELDLSKAHLAIAATEWSDLPITTQMLTAQSEGSENMWDDLVERVGLSGNAGKAAVKRGVYSIVYGAEEKKGMGYAMREEHVAVAGSYPPSDPPERLTGHPMIQELLDVREMQFAEIVEQGGMEDCFGRWVSIESCDHTDHPERSVLAQIGQARELWMMVPILNLAEAEDEREGRPRFEIVLYQFDGVTVRVRDRRRREHHVRRLQEAVNARARAAGYKTELQVDWPPMRL